MTKRARLGVAMIGLVATSIGTVDSAVARVTSANRNVQAALNLLQLYGPKLPGLRATKALNSAVFELPISQGRTHSIYADGPSFRLGSAEKRSIRCFAANSMSKMPPQLLIRLLQENAKSPAYWALQPEAGGRSFSIFRAVDVPVNATAGEVRGAIDLLASSCDALELELTKSDKL